MMTLADFVTQIESQIAPHAMGTQLAWWNLATTGEEKYSEEYNKERIALRKIYSSAKDYAFLKNHSGTGLTARQRQILWNHYRENQIPIEWIEEIVKLETIVEEVYTNFRPLIQGKAVSNNDLKKILMESNDSNERQQAWEASKVIGTQVEAQIYTLIRLRNDASKKAGFSDYYSMSLELQELDQTRLFSLLDTIEEQTNPLWHKYRAQLDQTLAKRFGISPAEIKPWHFQDPFFQEAPQQRLETPQHLEALQQHFELDCFYHGKAHVEICRTFFKAIGLPVDDILARSDLYEREHKSQHAFCVCIDQKQDIRTLCNLRDNEYWMGTLLHELGHAVYYKFIDQTLPFLLRTCAHTSTTEAIAMLFGRLSKEGDFLHLYCGIDKTKAAEVSQQTSKQIAASLLVFARWVLVMAHFERAMYQKENCDLNAFWWECVERFQFVKPLPDRHQPDWASKLHLACAPAYYQNYLLGEMTASHLLYHLQNALTQRQESFLTSSFVGKWLTDNLFQHGAKRDWEDTLTHATGEPLNPGHFVQDLK